MRAIADIEADMERAHRVRLICVENEAVQFKCGVRGEALASYVAATAANGRHVDQLYAELREQAATSVGVASITDAGITSDESPLPRAREESAGMGGAVNAPGATSGSGRSSLCSACTESFCGPGSCWCPCHEEG